MIASHIGQQEKKKIFDRYGQIIDTRCSYLNNLLYSVQVMIKLLLEFSKI